MSPSPLRFPLLLLASFLTACGARSPLDVTLLTVDGGSSSPDAMTPDAPPDVAVDAACGMPPPPPSLCTNPQGESAGLGIAGTLNGAAVESTLCTQVAGNLDVGLTGVPYASALAELALPGQGILATLTYGGGTEAEIESAIVGYDSDSPLDVDWYCTGPGSSVVITETMNGPTPGPASLVALRLLGACSAAQPVSGSITYNGTSELDVTLGATTTTFPMTEGIDVSSSTSAEIQVNAALPSGENAALVALWFDGEDDLTAGIALMGPDGPDPGAVYCITSGTSAPPGPTVSAFKLGGLLRLGTCAAAPEPVACSELELAWPSE